MAHPSYWFCRLWCLWVIYFYKFFGYRSFLDWIEFDIGLLPPLSTCISEKQNETWIIVNVSMKKISLLLHKKRQFFPKKSKILFNFGQDFPFSPFGTNNHFESNLWSRKLFVCKQVSMWLFEFQRKTKILYQKN